MTPDRATRRKRRRIRLAIRRTSALAAAIAFFFAWGTIGAIETDAVSLVEGTVRTFGLLFIGTGFAFVGGAFRNPTERRSKHEVHRDTVGRPGRTSRQKRFKIGLFTITLGMVLVGASFALADDKAVAEGIILPEELNETTAILTPSMAIAENEPTTQSEEWIDAVATAYCPCEICCGKWALNRPDGIVYTASGAIAEEGVTIAADWSVYSPGTILYIEGIGERTVQDRGGAISGQKIDVFFNNHEDALHFGRQEIRIKVISDTER